MSATVVFATVGFDSDHRLVLADICTPCSKMARYVKRAAVFTKKHVNLNYLKQHDISERFVNTTLEKLENLDLNSINSVINDRFISSITYAKKQNKTQLHQPWHDDIILKELHDLKDQQIAQNANSNKLSKTWKRIRLRAKFLKNEYFEADQQYLS